MYVIIKFDNKGGDAMCTYILMHKNIPVLTAILDDTLTVTKVTEIINPDHKPLNMMIMDNQEIVLNDFLRYHAIPSSRPNLEDLLEVYHASDALEFSLKSYQLNLSDHYWMKPIHSNLDWDTINFYDHPIIDTPLFLSDSDDIDIDLITPNSSVNGSLRQMWVQQKKGIRLLKAGNFLNQQPFNEVFVSKLCKELNFHHVPYELETIASGEIVSSCPLFTSGDIEYIPAWHIAAPLKRHDNKYQAFLDQCTHFSIPNVKAHLDATLALDYLTLNDDRHYGNFGFLRNSTTLEFLGMAPIFDNGNTLWYNEMTINPHRPFHTYPSLPFKSKHDKQIKYITTPLTIPQSLSKTAMELMDSIYAKNSNITEERLTIMKTLFTERLDMLNAYLTKLK